mgnify:CR=1 FL=1|jgi:hypothetical protein
MTRTEAFVALAVGAMSASAEAFKAAEASRFAAWSKQPPRSRKPYVPLIDSAAMCGTAQDLLSMAVEELKKSENESRA